MMTLRLVRCAPQNRLNTLASLVLTGVVSLLHSITVMAEIPNPVISRNVPAFALNGSSPSAANDASYATEWRSNGQPSWIAYDLSGVPSAQRQQILVAWHNNSGGYYDVTVIAAPQYNYPGPYVIEGNPAPGGGSAPASGWVVLATSPNPQNYRNNQHYIPNFGGNNWLRFRTTASNPNNDSGNADISINLDVHDVHLGVHDSWMFYGDSITYNCWDPGTFAPLINAAQPTFFPAVSMGGVPFLKSSDAIPLFPRWLPLFPGSYVGISYGTNDAGGATPSQFYASMKNLADQVIAAGKHPVIPSIPWATAAQRSDSDIRALNAQIVQLKADYHGQILDGPDLYSVFQNRSDLLGDGLHPNAAGNVLMRKAWADKMLVVVYGVTTKLPEAPTALQIN